ncbi:4-sulfomuconolactone hydrolase [Lolium rigidum]|uniref:4-sulfomuconolactone hydrolase n=1 Tax=Lolium rigidum TaxID=89674 RepID=UPI001F5E15AF|nr:4-sulfomuconolactone hydrolase [Lolium rigidum]
MAASSSAVRAPCRFLSPLATTSSRTSLSPTPPTSRRRLLLSSTTGTICAAAMAASSKAGSNSFKVVDSHLHVWASPLQAAGEYPFFPGQEATLRGDADFLLECMDEAGVAGALIVQPINHMFDHSLVTSVLKKYPSKFIGCCLANPADDGSGIKQLEHLIVQEKYRAVRFNPNLWPSSQKMTNEVGRSLFAKAGELGAPVGIMVMKGISSYIQEIEELCMDYPATTVILDHMAFCKPPTNDDEEKAFSSFLNLSRFPQVYVKYSALFRITRESYPYEDTSRLLSRAISSYGANRIMWGSDFPYVIPECGYKGAKEAISHVAGKIAVSTSDLEWILGKTVSQLFQGAWVTP